MNKEFYAVSFDNDTDFPGMLQWLNMGGEFPGNLVDNYNDAKDHMEAMKEMYPDINYKIVTLVVQSDDGYPDEGYDDDTHQ